MRLSALAVLIAVLIPVAACSDDGDPSAAPSAANGGRKDELCLAYRQSQSDMAAVFLEAVDVLTAAETDPAGIEEAKRRLMAAHDTQKATLEAEIGKPGDAETVAAIREFLTAAGERRSELQAAGGDPMVIADIVLADKGKALEDKVLEVCAGRGLLPKP